jgi:hypothetical protein
LLVVDENGYDPFLTRSKELILDENGYIRGTTCWSWTKTVMTFFLTKGRELTMNEN